VIFRTEKPFSRIYPANTAGILIHPDRGLIGPALFWKILVRNCTDDLPASSRPVGDFSSSKQGENSRPRTKISARKIPNLKALPRKFSQLLSPLANLWASRRRLF
jgi:hypothetical protein